MEETLLSEKESKLPASSLAYLKARSAPTVGSLPVAASRPTTPEGATYYLVEYLDGEFPKVRSFKNPYDLARRIAVLDQCDVSAQVFRGDWLPVTQSHPPRYLLVDEDSAIPIRKDLTDGMTVPITSIVDVPLQKDGYLGPEFLAPASSDEIDES